MTVYSSQNYEHFPLSDRDFPQIFFSFIFPLCSLQVVVFLSSFHTILLCTWIFEQDHNDIGHLPPGRALCSAPQSLSPPAITVDALLTCTLEINLWVMDIFVKQTGYRILFSIYFLGCFEYISKYIQVTMCHLTGLCTCIVFWYISSGIDGIIGIVCWRHLDSSSGDTS